MTQDVEHRGTGRQSELAERGDRVATLYATGMSAEAIASVVKTSPQTVLNDLKAGGIGRRPHGPRLGSARRRRPAETVGALRSQCVEMYKQGAATATIARNLGVSKTTVGKYLEAEGVARRPPGRQAESPLPVERNCEAEGCTKIFRPRRSQALRGWGRFCSVECMAEDVKRRDASRVSITRLNLLRRIERDRMKSDGNLLEPYEVADMCGVTVAQVHEYATSGAVDVEKVEIIGLPFLLFARSSVEAMIRGWRRGGSRIRKLWLDPDFVVTVYEARGLTERFAKTKGLSVEDARAVIRDRVTRRRKSFPAPRGRPKGAGRADYHDAWLEMFLLKEVELWRDYEQSRDLGLLVEGDPSPRKMDIALAVAENDFSLHPERWNGYPSSPADRTALDPALARSAARRVWQAVKPLLNAVREIQQS
jgi:DNA-binding CsgD family transcriptional regulator